MASWSEAQREEFLGDFGLVLAKVVPDLDVERIAPDRELSDLNASSLQLMEVLAEMEDALAIHVPDAELMGLRTVGDVVLIKLTLTDGRLYLQADPFGAEPVELFPESESQFFAEEGFSITLNKNKDGSVTTLTLHAGQVHEAKRIS